VFWLDFGGDSWYNTSRYSSNGGASIGAYAGMVKACLAKLNLLFLLIGLSAVPCAAKYGGGLGTAQQPYLIYTAAQMNAIGADANDWDKHFALMADIDLSAYTGDQFNLIGQSSSKSFSGVFDGRGHTISNFMYQALDVFVGIFSVVGDGGVVRNLGIVEPNVLGNVRVGALAGSVYGGALESCWVKGGLVRALAWDAGGLAGDITDGVVADCYCRGVIVDTYSGAGGLAALSDGGVVVDSYVANEVAVGGGCGAFVGQDANGIYEGCFYDANVAGALTGTGDGNDPCGLVGESTANLQLSTTFIGAGWDIVTPDNQPLVNAWRMCEDGVDYPHIAVEYLSADFACPDGVDTLDLAAFTDQWLFEHFEADVDFDGDHHVTFRDWAVLAAAWRSKSGSGNYNPLADIYPAGGDGKIDERDVAVFIEYWLDYGSAYLSADIVPYGGDGTVDFADFAAFANQWLQGN
jgi:hypothetical protein